MALRLALPGPWFPQPVLILVPLTHVYSSNLDDGTGVTETLTLYESHPYHSGRSTQQPIHPKRTVLILVSCAFYRMGRSRISLHYGLTRFVLITTYSRPYLTFHTLAPVAMFAIRISILWEGPETPKVKSTPHLCLLNPDSKHRPFGSS